MSLGPSPSDGAQRRLTNNSHGTLWLYNVTYTLLARSADMGLMPSPGSFSPHAVTNLDTPCQLGHTAPNMARANR